MPDSFLKYESVKDICVWIVVVGTLLGSVSQIQKWWSNRTSKTEIGKLRQDLTAINGKLDNDYRRINNIEERLVKYEQAQNELKSSLRLMIECMQALIDSSLQGGNNHEELKNMSNKIDDHLRGHI